MPFYRTTYKVVVLSDEEIPEETTLTGIHHETFCGGWVLGNFSQWPEREVEELTPEEMRSALIASQSDPDFFGLEDDEDSHGENR